MKSNARENEIRDWVALNTEGRDDPGAPVRYDIQYMADLLALLDDARAETEALRVAARADPA